MDTHKNARAHGARRGGKRAQQSRRSAQVQHHAENRREMGRALPQGRRRWFVSIAVGGAAHDIRKSAHRLGGLFGQFGAADVAERATELEGSDDATAVSMANRFADQCEAAVSRIADRVRGVTAKESTAH